MKRVDMLNTERSACIWDLYLSLCLGAELFMGDHDTILGQRIRHQPTIRHIGKLGFGCSGKLSLTLRPDHDLAVSLGYRIFVC